jgi:hypothetical protein
MCPLAALPSTIQGDIVISWHQIGTVKNQRGSVHTIPYGRADRLSPQPRISTRGANQRRLEIPSRWAASLARHLSAHLHSRKMKPPWLRHGPKTERPAASHHRSDFGLENRVTLFQYRIGAEAFSRFEHYCTQRKRLGSFTLFAAAPCSSRQHLTASQRRPEFQ